MKKNLKHFKVEYMDALPLEFVCELTVNITGPQEIGDTGTGNRKIVPLAGGTFKGPKLQGIILPGGADWQLIKENGVADINARYTLQTDDDVLIYISNSGLRVASNEVLAKISNGEVVHADEYYFRTVPLFEKNTIG